MLKSFTCHRHKLREGASDAVAAWAHEMNSRSPEVLETLRAEGVDLELVLLEKAADGDYLIFILKTDDYDRAVSIFSASTAAIDDVHRRFLAENVIHRQRLEVLSCHAS